MTDDSATPFHPEADVTGLEMVIAELQEPVSVSGEWRMRLEKALAAAAPTQRARRWSFRPVVAIAAALACMVVGAIGSRVAFRSGFAESLPGATDVGVRFAVMAPGVQRVSVVGDFNQWNPTSTPLELADDGKTWSVMLPLGAGRHTYAFVIDGEIVADPSAPRSLDDDFGKPSSLVLVSNTVP